MTSADDPGSRYRLLVFDWDGTLRDSIATILGCARDALTENDLDADDDAIRGSVGLGMDAAIRTWVPHADENVRATVREAYRRLWLERWHSRGALFPWAAETLHSLHRDGYWLAIATGKGRSGLERDLGQPDASPVVPLFLATRTVDESPAKPSPAMVLEITDELGVRPSEALVIGDSHHDLEMAASAGCDAVAVASGALPPEQLERHRVPILPHAGHLPAWLSSRSAG